MTCKIGHPVYCTNSKFIRYRKYIKLCIYNLHLVKKHDIYVDDLFNVNKSTSEKEEIRFRENIFATTLCFFFNCSVPLYFTSFIRFQSHVFTRSSGSRIDQFGECFSLDSQLKSSMQFQLLIFGSRPARLK